MKILIIGGGNMGYTYAQSFLKARIVNASDLMLLEKQNERSEFLRRQGLSNLYTEAATCLPLADLVIIAVKPQDANALFATLRPMIDPQQVFLSIMAGVKMQTIRAGLGAEKIIRSMPNLPAQIGMGMTAFTSTDAVTRIELVTVQNLLNTTGKAIYTEKEDLIDAATAISGSGPAYVFFFMDALMAAAKQLGFNDSEAELLVGQTFMGAVHLQRHNDLSCKDWIKQVASKGGTTEAALNTLNEHNIFGGIVAGAISAYQRAVELGS